MQRPRNRQPRPPQQNNRGRGGRTHGPSHGPGPSYPTSVPNITQVLPAAPVSIILKIDQPTGREVQGIVSEVLTRGNHPRGIKVRLVDGRVGRVQRMVSLSEGEEGSRGLSGLGRNGDSEVGRSSGWGSRRYGDVREDGYLEPPREGGYSLGDFLPHNHPLMNSEGSNSGNGGGVEWEEGDGEGGMNAKSQSTSQICPVCGEFEGDEVAVSRHVGEHFD